MFLIFYFLSVTREHFKLLVKLRASCKTTNVIYLIQCRRCGLKYMEETGRLLHCWMNKPHFKIAHSHVDKSVVIHFTSEGHTETNLLVIDHRKMLEEIYHP